MKPIAAAWTLAGLLAVSGVVTTLPLAVGGPAMFAWDDTEYVTQALETYEHVNARGLVAWPGYVVHQQPVKPPLYVNTLTAALFAVGRERAAVAAGLVGGAMIVCFGLVVYRLASRLTHRRIALAATAALLALPGVSRWFAAAYPDAQLAVLTLLAVGLLAGTVGRWRRGRTVLLGLAIGLALLSKTTFPLYLVLPAAYWLLRRGAGWPPIAHRVSVLAEAALIAACVASVWYVTQGEGALHYARVSSGFELGPVADHAIARAGQWLDFLTARGWGYALVGVAVLGLVAVVPGAQPAEAVSRGAGPASRDHLAVLILGALPMLLLAAWSRVPPNTRHPLPSLVLVAAAVLLWALSRIDRSRWRRILWPLGLGVIALQWLAVLSGQIPPIADAVRSRSWGANVAALAPGLIENRPISLEAASIVLDRARAMLAAPGAPTDWYLSGNSAYLNVSRLRMLAKLHGIPVNVQWGSYFTWSDADRAAKRDEMRSKPSVVILYDPVAPPGTEMADLNRFNAETRAWVGDPTHGFEALGEVAVPTEPSTLSWFIQRPAGSRR